MTEFTAFHLLPIVAVATGCTAESTPTPVNRIDISVRVDGLEKQVTQLHRSR